MEQQIKNDSELTFLLFKDLRAVVDYMVQKIWNENKEIIRLVVYEAYKPTVYNRTHEFQNAWRTEVNSTITDKSIQGKFSFDPSLLSVGSDNPNDATYGQHISGSGQGPMQTYLADIIYQGLAGPAFGHGVQDGAWAQKRNAWEILVKRIGKNKLHQWFQEGCAQVGLSVHRNKVGIKVS